MAVETGNFVKELTLGNEKIEARLSVTTLRGAIRTIYLDSTPEEGSYICSDTRSQETKLTQKIIKKDETVVQIIENGQFKNEYWKEKWGSFIISKKERKIAFIITEIEVGKLFGGGMHAI